jgi:hypothetical protein
MRRLRSVALVIGLCAGAAACAAAPAQDAEFVGRWHWDRTQSALPPGEPVPQDVTIDILRADPGHLTWSVSVLATPGGGPQVETYDAPADGTFRPINSDTMAASRVTGGTLQVTFKGPAGQLDTLTCALSAGDKRMSCSGAISDRDGRTARYVDVYDRI